MSNEGIDPCECMWNHLTAQHLLSILRQSQDYCSDTECFGTSRIIEQQDIRESSYFIFTWLLIGFVIIMYIFRPRSLRQLTGHITKSDNEPDSRNNDPSPPTVN